MAYLDFEMFSKIGKYFENEYLFGMLNKID